MSNPRHERLTRLFIEALSLEPREQAAHLEAACPDDPELRAEVVDLLARDRASSDGLDPPGSRVTFPEVPGYRILGLLGQGGMGVVYEAEQEAPARRVALKVLRQDFAEPTRLRRFAREANVLAQLENPAIARIYQIGTVGGRDGLPFFAMELVQGKQLRRFAEDRALTTRQRLDLFARICDGVDYAHQKSIIHRDLKPGNILVTDEGDPKILDFGIARAIHAEARVTSQTDVGQIVGTLAYMSPEQATGPSHELDTRTDVYSLGVVLYELLAGRLPYDLTDRPLPEAVRVIHDVDPMPIGAVDPALRGDVQTIVSKALEKDRDRRYRSAAELAADVRRFLRDEPIVASPTSTFQRIRKFVRRNRPLVAGFAVAVLALVAGAAGSVLFAGRDGEKGPRAPTDDSAKQSGVALPEAKTGSPLVVFVSHSRGAAKNPGTAGSPFLTMQRAVKFGESTGAPVSEIRVEHGVYTELQGLTFPRNVNVTGGLDAVSWAPVPGVYSTIIVGTGAVFTQSFDQPAIIRRIEIVATDAPTDQSSIALRVLRSTAALQFVGCRFQAGNGGNGSDGSSGGPGVDGSPGSGTNLLTAEIGGTGGNGQPYGGGNGGNGGNPGSAGGNGAAGQGPGAVGGSGSAGSLVGSTSNGSDGSAGLAGSPGAGGAHSATAGGSLLVDGSWSQASGGAGGQGDPGKGGGGGGGSGGVAMQGITDSGGGAGGGGGGGAGGLGGGPGSSGGASFAVVVLDASPIFQDCEFVSGNGGAGGAGGTGGPGGSGGPGASGASPGQNAGSGGAGGAGGDGGRGGGGAGGHGGPSWCVYPGGTSWPSYRGNTVFKPGSGGPGGAGGAAPGGNPGRAGGQGTSGPVK